MQGYLRARGHGELYYLTRSRRGWPKVWSLPPRNRLRGHFFINRQKSRLAYRNAAPGKTRPSASLEIAPMQTLERVERECKILWRSVRPLLPC